MSTIITINEGDSITNSRADLNTNFSNLNADKFESSNVDTDTTLSANSDSLVPSQKAVKAYVDAGGDPELASKRFKYTFYAGEDLSAGDAVFVSDGDETANLTLQTDSDTNANCTATAWCAQKILIPTGCTYITTVKLSSSAGGSGTYTCRLRSSATGSDLTSTTASRSTNMTFTLNYAVTAGNYYYIVVNSDGAYDLRYKATTNPYSDGSFITSTDSGSTWSSETNDNDMKITVAYKNHTAGRVYKTSANTALYSASYYNYFLGFAAEAITSGNTGSIYVGGVVAGLSSLSPGTQYFISDTLGAIASSAGTASRKIGMAVSSTELLIKNDNV